MGFKCGFSINEIYDMEIWELNIAISNLEEEYKRDEKQLIKTAYYTAMFNNGKKIKPLKHYLEAIDKPQTKQTKEEAEDKLAFAKKMSKILEKGG